MSACLCENQVPAPPINSPQEILDLTKRTLLTLKIIYYDTFWKYEYQADWIKTCCTYWVYQHLHIPF